MIINMIIKSIQFMLWYLLMLLLSSSMVIAKDCSSPAQVSEITPGTYVRMGVQAPVFEAAGVANIGFIVGDSCVAVIDTGGSINEGRDLRCAIETITPLPVCYIVMSHVHPDHILGTAALRELGSGISDTEIIGHANLPRAMKLLGGYYLTRLKEFTGQNMQAVDLLIPDRTVPTGQSLRLDLGNRVITLQAHASAHTDNDLSIYDETGQTLWAGDLVFLGHVPVVDGSSKGWLQVLQDISGINARYVVPGHGPVQQDWPQAVEPTRKYLEQIRSELRAWIDQGHDMLTAQSAIGQAEREHWLLFDEYHKRNISKIYAELEWE